MSWWRSAGTLLLVVLGLASSRNARADEHEGDGVAWLPLTSGLVLAS